MNAILSNAAACAPKRVDQVEIAGGGTAPKGDFANDAVQQIIASYTFAMNAVVERTYDRMMKSLLDVKT